MLESILNYQTALSTGGAANSAFYLQWHSNAYRFCLRQQVATPVTDCANATAAVNKWTFVTGIWDAANGQARIELGGSSQGAGTTQHQLASGETSATGPVLIGSSVSNSIPGNTWDGAIADPFVAQGVIDTTQLGSLRDTTSPDPR